MSVGDELAWLRTRQAVERTFLAWLRTAASMIGFGFAIVKFFEGLSSLSDVKAAIAPRAPRDLGLMLIAAGVVSLAIAIVQFRTTTRQLRGEEFAGLHAVHTPRSPALALAIVLVLIGVFAFVSIAIRM